MNQALAETALSSLIPYVSHFTPTDASDGCASLFGDTDYINKHATPTSKPAQRTQNRNSPVESVGESSNGSRRLRRQYVSL